MKVIVAVLMTLSFAVTAQASEAKWETKRAEYSEKITGYSKAMLRLSAVQSVVEVVVTCGAGVGITMASYVAETLPVGSVASELLANIFDNDYITVDPSANNWQKAGNALRGTSGGAAMVAVDMGDMLLDWLAGNDEEKWERVKKVYASSLATQKQLSSEGGACKMSQFKVGALVDELATR